MNDAGEKVKTNIESARDEDGIDARRADVELNDWDHAAWHRAQTAQLTHYWSGEAAPPERHAEARLVWSQAGLCVRFVCRQSEPLIINAAPQTNEKTIGLWDRDVCEIFVAPYTDAPEKYFEFEAAPTGEWVDLALRLTDAGRETDWHYRSGMKAAASIDEGMVKIAMHMPWTAFGRHGAPPIGTRWRINLFRCIGVGRERYMAWRPTGTAEPNFHMPEAFGWLCFSD